MEKLIICRHGEEDGLKDVLTENGRGQIRRLADHLRSHVHERPIVLISSPSGRTKESAEILCGELGLAGYICREDLLTERKMDLKTIVAEYSKTEVVILMAHVEHVQFSECGIRTNFNAKNGAARIILWGKKREAVVNDD
jgi:broad specificity phosphatase PhoE